MTKEQRKIAAAMIERMKYENGTTDYIKYADMMKIKHSVIIGIVGVLKDMKLIDSLDGVGKTSIRLTENGFRFSSFFYYNTWQRHGVYQKILVAITTAAILAALTWLLKTLLLLLQTTR